MDAVRYIAVRACWLTGWWCYVRLSLVSASRALMTSLTGAILLPHVAHRCRRIAHRLMHAVMLLDFSDRVSYVPIHCFYTLLVGRQEGHPACKKLSVGC